MGAMLNYRRKMFVSSERIFPLVWASEFGGILRYYCCRHRCYNQFNRYVSFIRAEIEHLLSVEMALKYHNSFRFLLYQWTCWNLVKVSNALQIGWQQQFSLPALAPIPHTKWQTLVKLSSLHEMKTVNWLISFNSDFELDVQNMRFATTDNLCRWQMTMDLFWRC